MLPEAKYPELIEFKLEKQEGGIEITSDLKRARRADATGKVSIQNLNSVAHVKSLGEEKYARPMSSPQRMVSFVHHK